MFAFAVAASPGMAPGIVGLFWEWGWMGKVVMAILLCFSELSVAKEGYIQREYKRAMR